MKTFLTLLAVAGLFSLSGCKYFENHRLFSKDVDTLLDVSVQEEAVAEAQTESMLEMIEEEKVEPAPVAESPVVSYTSDGKYFMIVGSFQNQNLAVRYAEQVQAQGYQTQIIQASNGYYRVSAKSFSSYREGVNEITGFRDDLTPGAWLHVKQ